MASDVTIEILAEIAVSTGKSFLIKLIGRPAKVLEKILADELESLRFRNQIRLLRKTKIILDEKGTELTGNYLIVTGNSLIIIGTENGGRAEG